MNAKNDINSKVNVIERCKEMLMSIKNPYRKNFYMKEVVKICEIDEEVLLKTTDLNKAMLPSNKGKVLGNIKYICEMDFIGSLFELSDETVQSLVEDLDENYFNDEDMKKIFKKIIENLGKGININILIGDKDIGNIVSSLMVNSEDDRDFYLIAIRNKNKLIYNYLNKKKKEMLLALSSMINEDKRKDILESLSQLVNKQKKLYTHLLEE